MIIIAISYGLCLMSIVVIYAYLWYKILFPKEQKITPITRQDIMSDESIEFINNYGDQLRILQRIQAEKLKESQK